MNQVEHIEDAIVDGSEGFFDHVEIRSDLHTTIRIARDFYDFLVKFGDTPNADDVDYMMGTIRSGMDEFFSLAYICRCIDTGSVTWSFAPHAHWDFSVLRESFMRVFEHLDSPNVSAVDRLASLFVLTHLELVFLAHHFPSVFFEEMANEPRSIAEARSDLSELLTDISELRAGRLSSEDLRVRVQARKSKWKS